MKIVLILFFVLMTISSVAVGQTTQSEILANHIATKMTDSLGLSAQQRVQLYNINISLNDQKMAIRQQYLLSDSLGKYLQRVENTRDSLYRLVLLEESFLLYKSKKGSLVSGN